MAIFCLSNGLYAGTGRPADVVGFATSDKQIRVNGRIEHGSVTLFEGDAIENGDSICRIHMMSGAALSLAAKSRIHLSAHALDLDEGSARISGVSSQPYAARVKGLAVQAGQSAAGTVSLTGRTVEVTALAGSFHIVNGKGTVIANIAAGQSLNLDPGAAGTSEAYSLTGCVVNSGKTAFLTDVTTGITVELRGIKVPAGKVVNVTGSAVPGAQTPAQATRVISVEKIRQVPGSCRRPSPSRATAAGAAAGTVAITSGAVGVSLATLGAGAAAATGAVVAGVAASSIHSSSGVAATNPPVTTPNCTSPCFLH